ncbi:MAG: hypothetical protein AUG11_01205 [Nitrospirae bacterium 13_1_20CM_2_62_14]|nr:MAG: hypothetical protein AUG11_01205 [Nitrospirae bacterium 13_1_20CM_2_62_14]
MARFTWRIVEHALIAPFHGQGPIRSCRSGHTHRHPLGLFLPAAQAGFSLGHPFRPRSWSLNREGQREQVSAATLLDTGHAQRAVERERDLLELRGERLEGDPISGEKLVTGGNQGDREFVAQQLDRAAIGGSG